jgi:4-amino-4-deoxy-L-arabinose transferase-like glycosyltransferase
MQVGNMSVSKSRLIMIIFVAAFILRLLAVVALRDIHAGPTRAFGADGIEFDELGQQVALGHGYELLPGHPTSFRAPGFPLFLAVIDYVAGLHYPLLYLIFCVLGAAACVLTYLVALELVKPPLALLAGVLAATYINGIYFATVFASESVYLVCFALSLWLFLRYLKNGSSWELFVCALSLGWGILTRPFALLLLPLFGSILLWNMWKRKKFNFGQIVMFAVIPLAVVAPWTIRNYKVFHHFVLIANNGGSGIYQGNNDVVLSKPYYLGAWISTTDLPYRYLIDAEPDEVSHDREEAHLGVQWIKAHLQWMPLLCTYKLVRLWLPDIATGNKKSLLLQWVFATPFLILMLIGLFWCLSRRRYWTQEWVLVHGIIAATVFVTLVFFGSPRYRDANIPVLMIYAAFGILVLLPRKIAQRLALDGSVSD